MMSLFYFIYFSFVCGFVLPYGVPGLERGVWRKLYLGQVISSLFTCPHLCSVKLPEEEVMYSTIYFSHPTSSVLVDSVVRRVRRTGEGWWVILVLFSVVEKIVNWKYWR